MKLKNWEVLKISIGFFNYFERTVFLIKYFTKNIYFRKNQRKRSRMSTEKFKIELSSHLVESFAQSDLPFYKFRFRSEQLPDKLQRYRLWTNCGDSFKIISALPFRKDFCYLWKYARTNKKLFKCGLRKHTKGNYLNEVHSFTKTDWINWILNFHSSPTA